MSLTTFLWGPCMESPPFLISLKCPCCISVSLKGSPKFSKCSKIVQDGPKNLWFLGTSCCFSGPSYCIPSDLTEFLLLSPTPYNDFIILLVFLLTSSHFVGFLLADEWRMQKLGRINKIWEEHVGTHKTTLRNCMRKKLLDCSMV